MLGVVSRRRLSSLSTIKIEKDKNDTIYSHGKLNVIDTEVKRSELSQRWEKNDKEGRIDVLREFNLKVD